ncbi:MAG: helix-turn-helix domain-containing protein [Actinomycetota bacterium]|nr:helix-turn-helix domain-containing protein [Actinomycetota bacterium]
MNEWNHPRCRRCGARLRLGHTDELCDPCARQGAPSGAQCSGELLPVDFFTRDRMREALAGYDFAPVLRSVRRAAGYSQQQLGDLVDLPQERISRIERGRHRLRDIAIIARIASRLGIPPALLGFTPGAGGSLGRSSGGRNCWHDGVGVRAEKAYADGVMHDLDRVEGLVAMSTGRALRFAATAEGGNIGPQTLEQLYDEVRRLVRAYPQQPVPLLLGELVEAQGVTFRLLEGRRQPDQARELYLLAGVTSGLLADASLGLGDPHAGMIQARTAFVCADNAGHDGLRAWVRGLQSQLAYWAGWPQESVRYAQLGIEAAARATGTAAVWLPAMLARSLAVLGDGSGTRAATESADAARERVSPDELDELGGALTFTRPRQLYYTADATTWLPGEQQRAEREAADAVSAYEQADQAERSYVNEALARADLALARAGLGELDGARDALVPVLDLSPARRVSDVITATLRVHTALRDSRYDGSPAAHEARGEIEAFCQAPAGAALPR